MKKQTIREARLAAGLSITDLAKRTRSTEDAVRAWDSGTVSPRQDKREKICRALSVTEDAIAWPRTRKLTALDMALKDKNFLKDTIQNFVCPAEFSKHYTNHCEGKYPDTSMCKKCWDQQAHPIERAGFGGVRRE